MKLSPQIEPAFFDLAGASCYLGGALSVRSLRRLIAAGFLPFYRVGRGKVMVSKADLERFMKAHRQTAVDLNALADEALEDIGGKQ